MIRQRRETYQAVPPVQPSPPHCPYWATVPAAAVELGAETGAEELLGVAGTEEAGAELFGPTGAALDGYKNDVLRRPTKSEH